MSAASPFHVHLRLLEKQSVHLKGKAEPKELDLEIQDEVVHLLKPIEYDLMVELISQSLLVQGSLSVTVDCECSRCLRPFLYPLVLNPWVCHIALEEDGQKVVFNGDAVDLTPYVREDIVLALPQQPLCGTECNGLPGLVKSGEEQKSVAQSSGKKPASIWDQLDKLKLS